MWKNSVSFHLGGKKKKGPMVNRRNQFPIVPAYATTVHKSQGLTLEFVILDFKRKSKKNVPAGAFYTAVTRVRSLDNLYLRNFEESHIRTDGRVKEQIEKLKTKPYKFLKRFLNQPCFENIDSELKMTYLNTNGLLPHIEDILADRNLVNSDIIVFSETKMKKSQQEVTIPNFECLVSVHSGNEMRGGMILYCKSETKDSVKIVDSKHISFGLESCYLEYIMILHRNKKYSFIYFHPTFSSKRLQWMKNELSMLKDSSGIKFKFIL